MKQIGLHTPMAAGTLPTLAGTSHQAIHGDGHATIMGAGFVIIILVGAGFPAGNGHRLGFHGASLTTTSGGALFHHQQPGPTM